MAIRCEHEILIDMNILFGKRWMMLLATGTCACAAMGQVAILSIEVNTDLFKAHSFAALTVMNDAGSPVNAVFSGALVERGGNHGVVADFRTGPVTVGPGTTTLQGGGLHVEAFRYGTSPIARSTSLDGRLAPGLYDLCVRTTLIPAIEEAADYCEPVEVEDLGTMDLVSPWDGDTIEDDRPVLSWTRLDRNPSPIVPAGHRLVLVEMRTGMDANAALQMGQPLFIVPELKNYFVPHPNGVPSLVAGKCYAWEVQRTSGSTISDRTGPWHFCVRKEVAPRPNKYVDLTGHGRTPQYEVVDDHVYFRVDEPYDTHELQCVLLTTAGETLLQDGSVSTERGRAEPKNAGVNLYDLDLSIYHLPPGYYDLVVRDAKKKEYRLNLHIAQRP